MCRSRQSYKFELLFQATIEMDSDAFSKDNLNFEHLDFLLLDDVGLCSSLYDSELKLVPAAKANIECAMLMKYSDEELQRMLLSGCS